MVRASPPELAREYPGRQTSSKVTCMPLCASWSADHPPNAPAPTTITEDPPEVGRAVEPSVQVAPNTAELLKTFRRELLSCMVPCFLYSSALPLSSAIKDRG